MATLNFGGVDENVVTREEFPVERAREVLKDETIAIIGYGVQGPGQSMNLRDNGFNVIVGQRKPSASWDKAVADGWVPGEFGQPLKNTLHQGKPCISLMVSVLLLRKEQALFLQKMWM